MPVQPLENQHAGAPKNINIAVLYAQADKEYWQGLKKHFAGLANIHKNIRKSLVEALTNYFESSLGKVHLCNQADNLHFFGLGPDSEGPLGERLYDKFLALEYPHLANDPGLQWRKIADASLVERLSLG